MHGGRAPLVEYCFCLNRGKKMPVRVRPQRHARGQDPGGVGADGGRRRVVGRRRKGSGRVGKESLMRRVVLRTAAGVVRPQWQSPSMARDSATTTRHACIRHAAALGMRRLWRRLRHRRPRCGAPPPFLYRGIWCPDAPMLPSPNSAARRPAHPPRAPAISLSGMTRTSHGQPEKSRPTKTNRRICPGLRTIFAQSRPFIRPNWPG